MNRTPKKRKYTDDFIADLAARLTTWINEPQNFWLGQFAAENGMGRQRLSELAARDPEFGKTYEVAKQIQENKIVYLAVKEKMPASVAIFTLKNVANWRDQQEVKHTGGILAATVDLTGKPMGDLIDFFRESVSKGNTG